MAAILRAFLPVALAESSDRGTFICLQSSYGMIWIRQAVEVGLKSLPYFTRVWHTICGQ
jgi:hypothetical protein